MSRESVFVFGRRKGNTGKKLWVLLGALPSFWPNLLTTRAIKALCDKGRREEVKKGTICCIPRYIFMLCVHMLVQLVILL